MTDPPRRRIAVAIIERGGRILVARRRSDASFPNHWELPGGRCQAGEDPAHCVVREVLEETGLSVQPQSCAGVFEHSYPDFTAEIHAFFCRVLQGEPRPIESQALAWISWDEIEDYRFPAANAVIFSQCRRLRVTNDE